MKLKYLQFLLFVVPVFCNQKFILNGIDKDQQQSEITMSKKAISGESLRMNESKYFVKEETIQSQHQQQQYHGRTTPVQELGNQLGNYANLQPYENFKYALQQHEFGQGKYHKEDDVSISELLSNSDLQHQQYYIPENESQSQNNYDPLQQQRQPYQQEIMMRNNQQTAERKPMTQKTLDESNDNGNYYVNVPMSKLLTYYNNYGLIHSKNKNNEQQIPIPIYTFLLSENQVYSPEKVSYQPQFQYVSSYPKYTQTVFNKALNIEGSPDTSPSQQLPNVSHQKYTLPIKISMSPIYESFYSSLSDLHKPQKTRQQHPQYGYQDHPFLDVDPTIDYIDIYNVPALLDVLDNSLHDHQKYQYYVPSLSARKLMMQILQQAGIRSMEEIQQNINIKQQTEQKLVHKDFSNAQNQAQKFHSTNLNPLSSGNEDLLSKPLYSFVSSTLPPSSSKQKTLLDSYIPSHVIAAQDVNRYSLGESVASPRELVAGDVGPANTRGPGGEYVGARNIFRNTSELIH